jgi:hypothetical protein
MIYQVNMEQKKLLIEVLKARKIVIQKCWEAEDNIDFRITGVKKPPRVGHIDSTISLVEDCLSIDRAKSFVESFENFSKFSLPRKEESVLIHLGTGEKLVHRQELDEVIKIDCLDGPKECDGVYDKNHTTWAIGDCTTKVRLCNRGAEPKHRLIIHNIARLMGLFSWKITRREAIVVPCWCSSQRFACPFRRYITFSPGVNIASFPPKRTPSVRKHFDQHFQENNTFSRFDVRLLKSEEHFLEHIAKLTHFYNSSTDGNNKKDPYVIKLKTIMEKRTQHHSEIFCLNKFLGL